MDKSIKIMKIARIIGTIFIIVIGLGYPLIDMFFVWGIFITAVNIKIRYIEDQREYLIQVLIREIIIICIWISMAVLTEIFSVNILITPIIKYI